MSWLAGYTTRRKLTIDATKIDSALSDFPVLVALTSARLDFAKANTDGFDIRFTSDDGTTLLKYERERHDDTNDLAEYHVKIPTVASGTDTDIYVYYRTTDTADGADPTNVWDSSFKAVMHLYDDPDNANVADSTSNGADAVKEGADNPAEVDGLIAKGQDITADQMHYADNEWSAADLAVGTIEVFCKTDNAGSGDRQPMNFSDRLVLRMLGTKFNALVNDGGWKSVTSTTTPSTASWYHVAFTWNGSTLTLYINGVSEGTPVAAGGPDFPHPTDTTFSIGSDMTDARNWDGKLDEFRVSSAARTAAWLKASTNSGKDTLLTYGAEETKPPYIPRHGVTNFQIPAIV